MSWQNHNVTRQTEWCSGETDRWQQERDWQNCATLCTYSVKRLSFLKNHKHSHWQTAEDGEYNTTLYIVLWGNGNHHKDSREGWRIQHNFIYCPVRKWRPPQRQQRRMEDGDSPDNREGWRMETVLKTEKDGGWRQPWQQRRMEDGDSPDNREGWSMETALTTEKDGEWRQF